MGIGKIWGHYFQITEPWCMICVCLNLSDVLSYVELVVITTLNSDWRIDQGDTISILCLILNNGISTGYHRGYLSLKLYHFISKCLLIVFEKKSNFPSRKAFNSSEYLKVHKAYLGKKKIQTNNPTEGDSETFPCSP